MFGLGDKQLRGFVNFKGELNLGKKATGLNFLRLRKANPCGGEENANSLRISVYIQ